MYDRLAASFDNAKASLGGYLAELAKAPAQQTANLFQNIADNLPQATPKNIQERQQATTVNLIANTKDVDAFNVAVQQANTTINQTSVLVGILGGYFNELTASTYEAAKAALSYGKSQEFVGNAVKQIDPLNQQFTIALQYQVQYMVLSQQAADQLQAALLQLAFSSEAGTNQAILLLNAFLDGKISADQLQVAINNINASNVVLSTVTQQSALALQREGEQMRETTAVADEYLTAIAEQIEKRTQSNKVAEDTKAIEAEIGNIAPQVAAGTLTLAQAVAILAEKFGFGADQANIFAGAVQAAANAVGVGDKLLALQAAQTRNKVGFVGAGSPGKAGTSDVDSVIAYQKAQEELAQSERELAEAQGGRAVVLKNLRADLAKTTKGSLEYNKTLARITELEQQGGSARLSDQQKLNNQLATNQDQFQNKVEKAYLDHNQRLLDIQREYEAKQLAAQKAAELSKRKSKADFYENLINADVNQQQFSAEYEAAYAEAQRIAQQGNKQLAQDYLELRQSQIEADIEYARKRKAIEESDLSKSEKADKLKALEGVNQLRKDAQQEELKQLLEGGDAINNSLQSQLDEEAQKYKDQLVDIGLTSSQLADLRIANWQRANQAIAGSPPAELLSFNAPQITAPTTEVTPQVQQTQTTIQDVVTVRDNDLINSVTGLGDRLAGKLDEVKAAIDSAQNSLAQKVGAVESAVRSLRPKLVTA